MIFCLSRLNIHPRGVFSPLFCIIAKIRIIKLLMTNKRTQFLSRLLRISQLNDELMELADKSIKQPAYAKKIKLIQMNPSTIVMPDPKNLPNNPEKNHGKIMIISKHPNNINQMSSYRSETILAEEQIKKSSISPVKLHQRQSKELMERKRTSINVQTKTNDEDMHFASSVTCQGRYISKPDEIYRRRINYKDINIQKRNQFEKRGEISTKIIHHEVAFSTENHSPPTKSLGNVDKIERKENPSIDIRIQREPKYFKSLHHVNSMSNQKQIEEDKKAKLSLIKEINKNYAKPFIPPPKITAKSYIICQTRDNDDFKVIVSYNSKNSQEVASLTKIMTCILTIQFCQAHGLNIDAEEVKIGKYESNIGGTSADLRQGQIYTVKQLLYGLMLPSGNDASLALAVWCGKQCILLDRNNPELKQKQQHKRQLSTASNSLCTERITKGECYSRFIKEMNLKAQSLKMNKTRYINSHGLINVNNRSTAFDIALLSAYSMKNTTFRQIVSCKLFNCTIKYHEIVPKLEELREEHEQVLNTEPDEMDQQEETIQKDFKLNLKGLNSQKSSRPATAKVESSRSITPMKYSMSKECISSTVPMSMSIQWQNTHKLLHSKPKQYLGIKTGITANAGPCLSSCVTIQDRKFIIVVLNCARINLRFKQTEILKKWLYKHEGLVRTVKKITNLKFTKSIKSMNNECEDSSENQQMNEEDPAQD